MLYLFTFPSGMEWILIFLAVLLLFGGRKIPELMKGIGNGIREFNSAKDKVKDNLEEGMKERDEEADQENSAPKTEHQAQK